MRLVPENQSFCGLKISKLKDQTAGPVFSGLGLVQLQSFSSLETGPSNTSEHCPPMMSGPHVISQLPTTKFNLAMLHSGVN